MKIEVKEDFFIINNTEFIFPIESDKLVSVIGTYSRNSKSDERRVFIWDDLGIVCYADQPDFLIHHMTLSINSKESGASWPKGNFSGEYMIAGKTYSGKKWKAEKMHVGCFSINNFKIGRDLSGSEISLYVPPVPIEDPDRYKLKKFTEEALEFKDFNFKLAVLEVLMYEIKSIKPKFDLYEFVERYNKRNIDIEEEGYDFIPEVTEYFKNLKIDKKLAVEITEINQDGSEIYGELFRFWDGEDEIFNIHSVEDAKLFPNLKKVTLFHEESPVIKNKFIELGIETDYV